MSMALLQDGRLPKPIMGYFPSTFLERGVAVPFTTPMLAGTRVRPGERAPLELLVPNPAGGRGVYILAWTEIDTICRPTLHDLRLVSLVAGQKAITPAGIRAAMMEVAAEGLAGRDARQAAERAAAEQSRAATRTNFDLLLALIRQMEPPGSQSLPPEQETAMGLEARARAATARVAPKLGLLPPAVAALLEQLASLYVPVGIGSGVASARLPVLCGAMTRMRREAAEWWQRHGEDGGTEAGLLAMVCDLAVACTESTLEEARGLTGDLPGLIQRWRSGGDELARLLARSEWLADGWDRIVPMWEHAKTLPERAGILGEIVVMLPVIPKEASDWLRVGLDMQSELTRHRRKIPLMEDWRTGVTLHDLIARNEQLVAASLDNRGAA